MPNKLLIQSIFSISCITVTIIIALMISSINLFHVYGLESNNNNYLNDVHIQDQKVITDSANNSYIVGILLNFRHNPITITLGAETLNMSNSNGNNSDYTILNIEPFTKLVYPNEPVPFKVPLNEDLLFNNMIHILDIQDVLIPSYDFLKLNYNTMINTSDHRFYGTIKNTGDSNMYNVSIFATARSENGTLLDSIKTPIIPIIKSGEELPFEFVPDKSIRSSVFYYSCAGLDVNAPINTLKIGNNRFLTYDIIGAASISNLRYDNSTASIVFGVNHYNPQGGHLDFKIPYMENFTHLSILLDNNKYDNYDIRSDNKTIYLKIFIPPKYHEVRLVGLSLLQ